MRVLIALAALAACYQPKVTSCQYTCGENSSCPDGESCTNGFCVGPGDTCTGSSVGSDMPPATPTQMSPANGIYTGSVTALDSLTPTFHWAGVAGAVSYDLDLAPCTTSVATCTFDGDQLVTQIAGTSYTPPSKLVVASVPPVGQRYIWRLRACNSNGCSDWSATRYLNVGRLRDDLDGDGRSELAIGCEHTPTVSIEDVDPTTGSIYSLVQCGPSEGEMYFGMAIAVGDFNGDGYADLVAAGQPASQPGDVTIVRGGPTLECSAAGETVIPAPPDALGFGQQIASVGDLDGDGYDDLVVLALTATGRTLELYFGSELGLDTMHPTAIPLAMSMSFALVLVSGTGDIDGDGYLDAAFSTGSSGGPSAVAIVPGNSARQFAVTTTLTEPGTSSYGDQIAILDLDGDGLADVFVAALDDSADAVGYVFAYHASLSGLSKWASFMSSQSSNQFGGAGLLPIVAGSAAELAIADEGNPVTIIDASLGLPVDVAMDPGDPRHDTFGQAIGGGDVSGTALTALVVGATTDSEQGSAFVCLRGSVDPDSFTCTVLADPHPASDDEFGASISP
ncbi:MAG TPA: VCBS repeat-containing protein [Kofleriaceae bacterium]